MNANSNKNENNNPASTIRQLRPIVALLVLYSLLLCMTIMPFTRASMQATRTTPTPTPQEENDGDEAEGEDGEAEDDAEPALNNGTAQPAGATASTAARPSNRVSGSELKQYIRSLSYDARKLLAVEGDGGTLITEKVKDQKDTRDQNKEKTRIIRCTRTERSMSKNFDDIAILRPTNGVIYPGALVYADKGLVDGMPRPLTELKRAPIELRLDLPGLEDEGTFKINDPSDSRVQASLNKALNFWNNGPSYKDGYVNASRSSYNSTIAYSSEQLAIKLGVNVKWASGDASAQFNYATTNNKTVAVMMYKQVFYTVTYDAPGSQEGFFDPSVSAAEAKEAFDSNAPPAYVSSVDYGRIIMFRMEADKSTTTVEAEAALKYATGAVTVGADMKMKYDKILSNSSITVVTMGGNAKVASESVSARSAEDLMPIIKGKNAVYSKSNPGVPISYTVKFVKDNTIAKMGSTTDYTTNDCKELDNLYVKVVHSGAYIADFEVNWDIPGGQGGTWQQGGKTVGFQETINLPGDATNVKLKIQNDTGLVWQPKREIINKVLLPKELNKCYQATGTTLGSGYNNDCS